VLVIAAHPDDELAGCAATLVHHRRAGDAVHVVYVTDGRGSQALGLDPDAMAARRRQEAEAGLRALGLYRFDWLGAPEGSWASAQVVPALESLVRRVRPQLIYAPSRVDFHPQHLRVAHALTLAARRVPEASCIQVRIYQVQVPLTPILTNLVASAADVATEVDAALRAHVTQAATLASAPRLRRYEGCIYGLGAQVESFWQLGMEGYAVLHGSDPRRWPTRGFRGLRARAHADPLAYLGGLPERRRLAALVAPR
jgi:LmbE family N-acetylglucosaminyl deacetylase